MVCPHCHLVNPPDAWRCDCGYDFRDGSFSADNAISGLRSSFCSIRTASLAGMAVNTIVCLGLFLATPLGRAQTAWPLVAAILGAFAVFAFLLSLARASMPAGWERCALIFGGGACLTGIWFVLIAVIGFALMAIGWVSPV